MLKRWVKIRVFPQCDFNDKVKEQVQEVIGKGHILRIHANINRDIFPAQLAKVKIITVSTFSDGREVKQTHFFTE
ncbi:Uncharacterised protein [Klebsiella pneumoniae]|nr:Uncharacterised protein [Klebsiella pneumoniae]